MKNKNLFINDLFTDFEFDKFKNIGAIDDSAKLNYIKEMVSFAKNDKQAVFMYFGFSLATSVFLLDKFDSAINTAGFIYVIVFYFGVALLLISALLFFTYFRKIHKYQLSIISCIPNLNIEKVQYFWVQLWKENKWYFKIGLLFLSSAIVILFTVMVLSKLLPFIRGIANMRA